jgi:hypothetical protein
VTDPLLTDSAKQVVETPAQDEASTADDSPKFGRLLIVLVIAVLLMGLLTFVSESYYS